MRLLTLLFVAGCAHAQAEAPIAVLANGGDRIELYASRADHCPDGSKTAIYTIRPDAPKRANEVILGCYVVRGELVLLGFLDGDTGGIRAKEFTWKPGSKPGTQM